MPQMFGQQCIGLVKKGARHLCGDFRQLRDIEISQPFLWPGIGRARVRVVGVGHELLTQTKHLQRMTFDAPERGFCAINQHPFWRLTDAQCGRIPQTFTRQLLNVERQFRILNHINIDSCNRAANKTDATLWPSRPCRHLNLRGWAFGVPVPLGVVCPYSTLKLARLFGARTDWQDAIAIGDQPSAEARHIRCINHQRGTSGVIASSRVRSCPTSARS